MPEEECLFCKIAKGEIPSVEIYKDDHLLAFLDINPVNKGHTLIVPRKHVLNLYEIDDDTLSKTALLMRDLSIAIKRGVRADGINIEMNNERLAGQIIDHAHLHIIPRFKNDGLKHWPGKKLENKEMEEVAKNIIEELN